jgi:hypothetical protein
MLLTNINWAIFASPSRHALADEVINNIDADAAILTGGAIALICTWHVTQLVILYIRFITVVPYLLKAYYFIHHMEHNCVFVQIIYVCSQTITMETTYHFNT